MPVGFCLGEMSPSGAAGNADRDGASSGEGGLDVIVTSSVLNTADQFAFMQQTLLMQIFRAPPITTGPSPPPPSLTNINGCGNAANGAWNGNGGAARSASRTSSGSSSNSNGDYSAAAAAATLMCPTCVAFSDHCCQQESGLQIFQEFLEANAGHYWDARLSEALASLRYQGYVCPGILIMIASHANLETVVGAWRRRLLSSPPGVGPITQVGISNGCMVKPVTQAHHVALQDAICLTLARLKQRNETADMTMLCDAIDTNFGHAMSIGSNARESVHNALGQLIKQRKVYYTGKGYFLVAPSHENTSPLIKGLGTRINRLRHSLRDRSATTTTDPNGKLIDRECQTAEADGSNGLTVEHAYAVVHKENVYGSADSNGSSGSPQTSPGSAENRSFLLERTQSLRVSKKSLRNMSKGGSLRLSKKDAMIISEEVEENMDESGAVPSPNETPNPSPNKSFERKNSFLGKLFSSRKNKSGSSPNGGNGNHSGNKPEIGTFSAQFPLDAVLPPDASYSSAIYTPIRKPHQQSQQPTTPPPPRPHGQSTPAAVSPMAQVRNGPNGNFVIYERQTQDAYGTSGQPVYGKVPGNNPLRYQYPRAEGMYSNPPPPLPFRPPPPNPYQSPLNPYHQQQQMQTPPAASSVRPQSPKTYHTPPSAKYQNGGSPLFVAKRNEVAAGREMSAYNSGSDMASGSSSSGPSSIDSQLSKKLVSPESTPSKLDKSGSNKLYDDSLVVIERSNQELEQRLKNGGNGKVSSVAAPPPIVNSLHNRFLRFNRAVDTIHNRLSQEVIYEVPDSASESGGVEPSVTTVASIKNNDEGPISTSSDVQTFPSISDLTMADISSTNFKSLTAQKLMAGLSFNSIDTLIEVNAVAEARKNLNESTETVDFGVI